MPVKIEDDVPAQQSNQQVGRKKFVNGDLPEGCEKRNRWRRVFIPSYIHFIASYSDPWSMNDDDIIEAMQSTWDEVFVDSIDKYGECIPHVVEINEAVFSIVSFIPY